ncbi:hypothetical protein RhiirA4_519857 [Rhizophagus irregularis]|uniref:SET domain-containing protein n=1 Tax=Rhizophagus irregularis TaxID=588596 RepID=A0A2I1HPF6_9GLOM|nr:hypothetical protein RhiirA4_519857 [Rhizophagus irregularis]
MKCITVTRTIDAFEVVQNAILRLTVDNFSQGKSREQLIDEHKRLDNFCDKKKYVVHNINKQENLTLNFQLRISISNLKVNNVPTGRFLLCRVISKFVKLFALLALVEDPEGNVERLALYNWTKEAFKVVFSNEAFGTMISNTLGDSCAEELTTCVTRKLFEEPYYCPEVYQLYNGLNLSRNEKNEIIRKNSIHIELIIQALMHNGVGLNYDKFNLKTKITGSGLWTLPSFLNHACIDENVYNFFLGDLLFIRTNRPISKGEELIINYRDATFSYEERLSYLKYMNIDCQCRMCKLERSESQEIKLRMAQLLKAYHESIFPKVSKSHRVEPSHIKELEYIIAELRSLRKEHPDLGFNTIELSNTLAFAYLGIGNSKKALSILKEVYDLYKTVRESEIRIIILDIIIINSKLKLFEEAKKWEFARQVWSELCRVMHEHVIKRPALGNLENVLLGNGP